MILTTNYVYGLNFDFSFLFQVTNQEAVDVVHPSYVGVDELDPLSACKKLVELSLSRGSVDDTSVMVIILDRFVP